MDKEVLGRIADPGRVEPVPGPTFQERKKTDPGPYLAVKRKSDPDPDLAKIRRSGSAPLLTLLLLFGWWG